MTEAPYGTWRSPIRAEDVARGAVRLGEVAIGADGDVWWSERRPEEAGRTIVMRRFADGTLEERVPPGLNVRTRVHEYGGGAWIALDDGKLVFANWDDQRLYLSSARDDEPLPLTPEPGLRQGDRYADLVLAPGGREVICVREREIGSVPLVARDIVAVPLDGSLSVRSLVVDHHFLSSPRTSPDGGRLCWLTWDHPLMPWDGTELRVAEIDRDGSVAEPRRLIGGPDESIFQPEWSSNESLFVVSDRTGWWNIYEVSLDGDIRAVCERQEEFGCPQWVFGMARYGILGDGRLAATHGCGTWTLSLIDPATGSIEHLLGSQAPRGAISDGAPELTYFESEMAVRDDKIATIAGGPSTPLSLVTFETSKQKLEVVRRTVETLPPSGFLPEVRQKTIVGRHGRDIHCFMYPPRNPDYSAPGAELPPLVATVHGGPTAQAVPVFDPAVAFFTSRGIGVVSVDYGGSAGYGREYRNRLRGQWGVVDVEDVIDVVRTLAEHGEADSRRLLVRGSSAGGWTVLAALTQSDVFAAGASYYGVADLIALAEDTHDFESRYVDGLVGPLPEARGLYDERSPLTHVDRLNCPVLLLQGSEDRIVPPAQAELFRDALAHKGIAHAYLLFEGEQHGFRRADSIERSLEAELSFYGQVLGFVPPDVAVLQLEGSLR